MKSATLSASLDEPHTADDPRCPVCGSADFERQLSRDPEDYDPHYGSLGIILHTCQDCGYCWKTAKEDGERVTKGLAARLQKATEKKQQQMAALTARLKRIAETKRLRREKGGGL